MRYVKGFFEIKIQYLNSLIYFFIVCKVEQQSRLNTKALT
jgi:hypothetical protein